MSGETSPALGVGAALLALVNRVHPGHDCALDPMYADQVEVAKRASVGDRTVVFDFTTLEPPESHKTQALVRALREMNNQFGERFEALRVGKAESVAIVEAMAEGVIAADNKGHVVIANTAARRLLGYEPDAQLPELAQLFRAKAARDVVSTVIAGITSRGRELDLGDCVVMISGRPLPGGGALLVLHDVTEIRRLEAVRRISWLTCPTSSRPRSPRYQVRGDAGRRAARSGNNQRFLEVILANARRMHRLVDGLLDLSRSSREGGTGDRAAGRSGVVRETWGSSPSGPRRNIGFVPQFDGKAGTIQADPDALRQILTNLFDNALRYTSRVADHGDAGA
jgi:two-component system phosphate regulon sensor histidine kinase PhoR